MNLVQVAIWVVVISILLTHLAIPWAARLATSFRLSASKLSPLSCRGIEWRDKRHASSAVPTVRVERIYWSWGGCSLHSKITLNVEGVTIRVRKKAKPDDSEDAERSSRPKKKTRLPAPIQSLVNYILHLLLHHWVSIASLVSLRIAATRVIVEDLDNLEARVGDVYLGFGPDLSSPPQFPPPLEPDEDRTWPSSPAADAKFSHDGGMGAPVAPQTPPMPDPGSRYARRSSTAARMARTASNVWSHAIGNAIQRVALSASISEVAVALPRPSHDPEARSLKSQASNSSLSSSARASSGPSYSSLGLNAWLMGSQPEPKLSAEDSVELLTIASPSIVNMSIEMGPRTAVFDAESTRVAVTIGELDLRLDGLEQVVALAKLRKTAPKPKPVKSPWAKGSPARVVLRALEHVSVSCKKACVLHTLPAAKVESTDGGADAAELAAEERTAAGYTMALDFSKLAFNLYATHSGSDPRLGKLFGRNKNEASRVYGVSANMSWSSITLQCIAPGEASDSKTELAAIRQANFDVLNTWVPDGWERRGVVFGDDPNLSVIIARGWVASLDASGDMQLIGELARSWKATHPPKPKHPRELSPHQSKPPRVRLCLEVGHMSAIIADGASKSSATISLESDGVSFAGQSTFNDHTSLSAETAAPPKQNGTVHNSNPPHAGSGPTSAKTREPAQDAAENREDEPYFAMRIESFLHVEPINLRLSLGSRNEKTYRIARIGRIECRAKGGISGSHRTLESGADVYFLLPKTLAIDIETVIDDGVKMEIWHPEVLVALSEAVGTKNPAKPKPLVQKKDLLDKLPSGVSVRIAIGVVGIFLGHRDLDPACDELLVRGVWLQTSLVIDYARFLSTAAANRVRNWQDMKQRQRLKLFHDISESALNYTTRIEGRGGEAALFSILLRDTEAKTVFNGQAFVAKGGTDNDMPAAMQQEAPKPPNVDPEYVAWGWGGSTRRDGALPKAHLNHMPKAYVSPGTFLRIPYVHVTGRVERLNPGGESTINVQARVELVHIIAYISDLYCVLLAIQAVRAIAQALKKPPQPDDAVHESQEPPAPPPSKKVSFSLLVPKIWVHFYFPFNEQCFLSFSKLEVEKGVQRVPEVNAAHVLMHVLSDTHPGMWDELGLIKQLHLVLDLKRIILINAAAFRIRIPYGFVFSQLVFNINMTIKTTKLMLHNLKTGIFSFVKKPLSEKPKILPHMKFRVDLIHFEARDHPVENKINLANRVGLHEQRNRLSLDEMFAHKVFLLAEEAEGRPHSNMSASQSVTNEEARYRLDWHFSRNWVKRIRRAKAEQRRREELVHAKMRLARNKLPIPILPLEQTVPLARFAFLGVDVELAPPNKTRSEIINYMSEVSPFPFNEETQFSLMVPFDLTWTMTEAKVSLRDYPLPLLRIHAGPNKSPGWRVSTLFVIAEELSNDDSSKFFPVEILPQQCGHELAKPLTVKIAKAIMPTKTYAKPTIKVLSPEATRLTWCTSYSPGLSDLAKVFEGLSNPPMDASPKPGFWDKLRLAFHWRVIVDFAGSVRWYLKGSQDPYAITGFGAGFALVWRRNVRIEIGQPNAQHELVQVMSEELLMSIPDLTVLLDAAAVGDNQDIDLPENDDDERDRKLIERRSTKPCARFLNGVRFGLGFVFERTCRPWTCTKCGTTENLLHRQCRIFDFRPHQTVVLKNPKVAERMALERGHPVDSFEGFRSDYIHFSVSLVAPREPSGGILSGFGTNAATHSSIHLTPKAFAHFFNWWNLFRSKIPAPIRQGKIFPDAARRSAKFGKSLATIKYRCDIAPIYVSHMYNVYSEDLWSKGQGQGLGLKFRAGRFRLDGHQRQQEQRQWSEALQKIKIGVHKPFYAADLLLDEITVKGIVANFDETNMAPEAQPPDTCNPRASELNEEGKVWFNYFDFIDSDFKPFDRDPRMEIVHIGDCSHIFLSRRVKALKTEPNDQGHELPPGMEASKFGHEKTHVCYLGAALGVGPMQSQIAQERVAALQECLAELTENTPEAHEYRAAVSHRVNTLKHHIEDLAQTETRHMDNSTLADSEVPQEDQDQDSQFENTLHVHCPRVFFNNSTRDVVYKYMYCRKNRKREEYTTSYASLRAIRDGVKRRRGREANGLNRDDIGLGDEAPADEAAELLKSLEKRVEEGNSGRYILTNEFLEEQGTIELPEEGLPPDCDVQPKWRILVLKPQIALRSTADPAAIVLVALNEIAMKAYNIRDTKALDSVVSDVLGRYYIAAKGLQGFYPTQETMRRAFSSKGPGYREMDFIPLEIFLDVKSEATDYDRIILKTDMGLVFDEFNHLRAPRGLEWPEAVDQFGDPIDHLRLHQNQTVITLPMMTVSATATHYTALYYIITDLLMYTLPEQRQRKEKVDGFLLKFDRRDRDPQQLMRSLFIMQRHIRELRELQRGYESNLERITGEGRRELFNIRADLLHEYESLNTVFDVINLNRTYEEAREALQTKSRFDLRAGNIAWHMLREEGNPLLKLNIKHTLFGMDHNQDGSKDLALAIADLQALNSNADALFTEVLTGTTRDKEIYKKKLHSTCFLSGSLSTLPQVGGISIVKELAFYLYPVRFRLEQAVGNAVVDYIFNDKTKLRPPTNANGSNGSSPWSDNIPLARTQSQLTLSSANNNGSRPNLNSTASTRSVLLGDPTRAVEVGGDSEAEEMRRRAANNRTFLNITVGNTYFVLDYKRDEGRKGHGFIPDVADFKLHAPEMRYRDKVWSGKDLLEEVKRDLMRSVWSQRGDLLSQMMKKTSVFRSKKSLRQIAGINTEADKHNSKSAQKSPLRFTVQPATPLDLEEADPATTVPSPTGSSSTTPARRVHSAEHSSSAFNGRRNSASFTYGEPFEPEEESNEPAEPKSSKKQRLFDRLRRHSRQGSPADEEVLDASDDEGTRRSRSRRKKRAKSQSADTSAASLKSQRSQRSVHSGSASQQVSPETPRSKLPPPVPPKT